jgi:putative transposase
MPKSFCELYVRLVWATKNREPLIEPRFEDDLFAYIRSRCDQLGVFVHALNGTADHMHLACEWPPSLAISDLVNDLKGASSHFVSHVLDSTEPFYWQEGYGALTFARPALPRIVAYVVNQKEHHRRRDLSAKMERIDFD